MPASEPSVLNREIRSSWHALDHQNSREHALVTPNLHELDEDAGTANWAVGIALGMYEGNLVAGSAHPNSSCEAYPAALEPYDALLELVDPQPDVAARPCASQVSEALPDTSHAMTHARLGRSVTLSAGAVAGFLLEIRDVDLGALGHVERGHDVDFHLGEPAPEGENVLVDIFFLGAELTLFLEAEHILPDAAHIVLGLGTDGDLLQPQDTEWTTLRTPGKCCTRSSTRSRGSRQTWANAKTATNATIRLQTTTCTQRRESDCDPSPKRSHPCFLLRRNHNPDRLEHD